MRHDVSRQGSTRRCARRLSIYPRVSADHDPERGHDGNTFGVLVWRDYRLDRLRWDSELRASLATTNARSMRQMAFELHDGVLTPEDEHRLSSPRLDLVIAHTGDPDLGSYDVSVGAPQLIEDQSEPWIWVRTLLSEPRKWRWQASTRA